MVIPAYPDSVSSSRAARRIARSSSAPRRRLPPSAMPTLSRYHPYLSSRPVPVNVRYSAYLKSTGGHMRAKGIGYDTGFILDGVENRPFDRAIMERELRIIRDDLHCTAVRLIGNDLDRIEFAASHAADLGLEVWFSPFPQQLDPDRILDLLIDGAARAERIRRRGADVVFVIGAELS